MPKYTHYAPDATSDEPPNSNDRYDFRRATEDARNIARRHVAILTGEFRLPRTKAWRIAMASIREVWPTEHTGGIVTGKNERGYPEHSFRCSCGAVYDNTDKGGLVRTRKAHAALHVTQRREDKELLGELAELEAAR